MAMAATSLDDCVERKHESGHKCKHVWEAGGEESLTPPIKNNIINSIILEHNGGDSRVRKAAPRGNQQSTRRGGDVGGESRAAKPKARQPEKKMVS